MIGLIILNLKKKNSVEYFSIREAPIVLIITLLEG